jgi:hypothetical protein
VLQPERAARRGLFFWPRARKASRDAVAEPMGEIITLLRDPAVEIPETALPHVLALATHPASPLYGPHPNQARFVAWSLADELRNACAPPFSLEAEIDDIPAATRSPHRRHGA